MPKPRIVIDKGYYSDDPIQLPSGLGFDKDHFSLNVNKNGTIYWSLRKGLRLWWWICKVKDGSQAETQTQI